MSAGRGVRHSERNASDHEAARLLQIWLIPDQPGGEPTYAQRPVPQSGDVLLAGPSEANPLLTLRSQTTVRLIRAQEGDNTPLAQPDTLRFMHLIDGLAYAEGERLSGGDGLQIPVGDVTSLDWASDGAALLFTMPR